MLAATTEQLRSMCMATRVKRGGLGGGVGGEGVGGGGRGFALGGGGARGISLRGGGGGFFFFFGGGGGGWRGKLVMEIRRPIIGTRVGSVGAV